MSATSAVGMTDITRENIGDFSGKFVAFERTNYKGPPHSDYYPLPSFSQTLFGYCSKSQFDRTIFINPLLKPTAESTYVMANYTTCDTTGKITTLFRMKVASNDECKEILSALKDDKAKVAYFDNRTSIKDLSDQMKASQN